MDHGPLHVTADRGVVTVTIDLPPVNVLGGELMGALLGLLPELESDPSVRVVVFRSADPDFFVMHGDVEMLVAVPPSEYQPLTEPNIAAVTFQRISAEPFVTIGVLDGAARGGGCELLSALDIRIGSTRAVIGQPEVPMGILPGAGGTVRWARFVGRARALEILLTGRDITAEEALALGWLQAVVPRDRIDDEAAALAHRIARMPPGSIAAVKHVVDRSLAGMDDALLAESDALQRLMAEGTHTDPMRRFLAAGGQTREGETAHMASLLDAMLDG